jgi:beta-phosphoglucomutase
MAKVKGFFFDLDGTLVDTYQADFLAYRDAVLDVIGKDLIEAEYAALHGMEMAAKFARLFPNLTEHEVARVRQAKRRYYGGYLHLTKGNESLLGMLAQLERDHMCALVTTAKSDNAAKVLDYYNIASHFKHIITGDDVSLHKPHPEAYLLALQRTGLHPADVLAFEDSASGIRSAESAGIRVVHIREFAP